MVKISSIFCSIVFFVICLPAQSQTSGDFLGFYAQPRDRIFEEIRSSRKVVEPFSFSLAPIKKAIRAIADPVIDLISTYQRKLAPIVNDHILESILKRELTEDQILKELERLETALENKQLLSAKERFLLEYLRAYVQLHGIVSRTTFLSSGYSSQVAILKAPLGNTAESSGQVTQRSAENHPVLENLKEAVRRYRLLFPNDSGFEQLFRQPDPNPDPKAGLTYLTKFAEYAVRKTTGLSENETQRLILGLKPSSIVILASLVILERYLLRRTQPDGISSAAAWAISINLAMHSLEYADDSIDSLSKKTGILRNLLLNNKFQFIRTIQFNICFPPSYLRQVWRFALGNGELPVDTSPQRQLLGLNENLPSRWKRREPHFLLGRGAYSSVYAGHHVFNGLRVAMKYFIEGDSPLDSTTCVEIGVLRSLSHPNIVQLLDAIMENGNVCAVLEFCDRGSLRDQINCCRQRNERFDLRTVKKYMSDLLSGLEYLHQKGIVHRDIKPENLFIDRDGVLKIGDFGLARMDERAVHPMAHTVYTIFYRPPDLLLGSTSYGCEADMWAAGCVFCEMLLGSQIFPGLNENEMLERIFDYLTGCRSNINRRDPKFVSQLLLDLSGNPGVDLLKKMLKYEPRQRITAEEALRHRFFEDFVAGSEPNSDSV